MKITAVKGFNDILPPVSSKWQYIESIARSIFHIYGYGEMRIPIVEKTEVFTRSIGESTDIVEKEMYSFEDKNGASLTLRPEGTASAVRAFLQNSLYSKNAVNKLYYMGPMFRYERPQKGRYRQFYQIGAELFGAAEPYADAEVLSMVMHFFAMIGIDGLSLQINSLGCSTCRKEYKKVLVDYFTKVKDELCENCARRLGINPLRILDCKAANCREQKKGAPIIADFLCKDCYEHFDNVKINLNDLSVPYIVNEQMVRGLDYYTKTTFEVTTDKLGAQNAVAAGGRYDNLCSQFGGPAIPAIGFALGMERLVLLLDKDEDVYTQKPLVFVAAIGESAKEFSQRLLSELRRKNISSEMEFTDKSLKSQMRRAGKSGYKHVLIIGDEELKNRSAIIRNMSTKEQMNLSFDNIVDEISKHCLSKHCLNKEQSDK